MAFSCCPIVRSCRFLAAASLLIALLIPGTSCRAEEFHNALSLEGFTGILNTPNAAVTKEGRIYALYSNQKENGLRNRLSSEDSFIVSVGLFNILEIGGRFTQAEPWPERGFRDISGNFKLKAPFIPEGLPQLAVGIQDIGGGDVHLKTKYVVASEEIWRLRISAGYGMGPNRMEGVFGGVELKACDWLYLLGENDTKETNLGLRLVTPEIFGIPVNLQVTAKTSLNHNPGSPEFGIGIEFPLGLDHPSSAPATKPALSPVPVLQDQAISTPPDLKTVLATVTSVPIPEDERRRSLERLKARLATDGFQNLEVGEGERHLLVVEYENSRYNHNELDGIGVVAGIVADSNPKGIETVRLVLKKKGIRMLQLSAPLQDLTGFLADAGGLERLRASLAVSPEISGTDGVSFVSGASNPSWLRPTLVLSPGLKTFLGTEVGAFDYLLSLKPELFVPLWQGAVIDARWDIPLAWSENFDDSKSFRSSRQGSRLERLMLFQTVKLAPTLMANIGAGAVLPHLNGTLNELLWTPGDAAHRLGLRQAYAEDSRTNAKTEVYLGFYRYRYAPLDLSLELTGGRFFFNDTGAAVELKRYFGDTLFSVYYKDVETAQNKHVQAGGIQFSFPLTPRRDMKATIAQVKGMDNWSYAQETVIAARGKERNWLDVPPLAINPVPAYNISEVFYNRDRLSEAYIKLHLLRLRDAYLRYVRVQR